VTFSYTVPGQVTGAAISLASLLTLLGLLAWELRRRCIDRRRPAAAPPAAGEAVRALRADGRRHVAVGLLFLAPGFLTDRVTELALEAGAVAVAEPLGADQEIAEIVLARYAVGAVDLVDLDALFADV
jgi:hypothetical protein